MSTEKHDEIMARTVPVTVSELADLAHEANALQADVVNQADAVRYLRDSLRSSNDARAVLVDELHKLDDELRSERSAFGVMEQTALTLRDQLAIETAKHARATRHIALMATGHGWLPGKPFAQVEGVPMGMPQYEAARRELLELLVTTQAQSFRLQDERDALNAEVARLTEGLASAHAAQGIVPLRFKVGDYVTLTEAHNEGVVGRQYRISEAKAGGSLPYYLGDDAAWVPESAVAEYVPGRDPEPTPEARPFKVGDRVEMADETPWSATGRRGIVGWSDRDATCWVQWDDREANKPSALSGLTDKGECVSARDLRRIEWESGERIEVGAEVEYVGGITSSLIGKRVDVLRLETPTNVIVREHGNPDALDWGVMPNNLRRIS